MFGRILLALVGVVATATMTAAAGAEFCFGWNIDKCNTVKQSSIPIMDVGDLDVSCDNCYFQTKGELEFDFHPLERKLRIGLENVELDFVGHLDALAAGDWSFDHSLHPSTFKVTLIDTHVEFVPIHVWLEVPLFVELKGGFSGEARGDIGISGHIDLGSWESIYDHGWKHIYPNVTFELTHDIRSSVKAEGTTDLIVTVSPMIHADDIFEGGIVIDNTIDVDIRAGSESLSNSSPEFECPLCKWIVNEVEGFLASNHTLEQIETVLERACGVVGDKLSPLCKEIIIEYLPEIVGYLESQLPPDQICQKLSLCSKGDFGRDFETNSEKCDVCTFITGKVAKFVENNETLDTIQSLMEGTCSSFGLLSGLCRDAVDQYLPEIVKYLEDKIPPGEICRRIGLCPATLSSSDFKICSTISESLAVDWKGELKLDWFNYDKEFDHRLVNFERDFRYGIC